MPESISNFDYGVIALYFGFMVVIGYVFRTFITSTSDYFVGGGSMLWWMTGSSAFMMAFSAWTFTGAASSAYTHGPIMVMTIFFGNAIGFFVNYIWSAALFRQMRVLTPIQAMRMRFGRVNEQFFTWSFVPTNVVQGGIWLNGLGVFCSAVFGFDLQTTIIVTGSVVVFVSLVGGSWAVVASDFMQVLVILPISIIMAYFALDHIGGVGQLIEQFPVDSIAGNDLNYSTILVFWVLAMILQKLLSLNNIMDAYRFLTAKDTENARKASLLASILFLVGPILWFIPPMVAAVVYPAAGADGQQSLGDLMPGLSNPAEGAYVAMGLKLLPAGMIGILLSAIFAATMSSMDSGLNRNAGIIVKNFYNSVLRPKATDTELLATSKITTALLGVGIISAAVLFSQLESLGLFDLMLQFSALIALPLNVPMLWGMVFKKTPDWSGWATAVFGLCVAWSVKHFFDPVWAESFFNLEQPLTDREVKDYIFLTAVISNVILSSLFFWSTKLFYKEPTNPERKAESDLLFENMHTPATAEEGTGRSTDTRQAKILGYLSVAYGAFIGLLVFIPNPISGRLAFLFCGCFLAGIGGLLLFAARKSGKRDRAAAALEQG